MSRRGFTLLELICVVGLTGLLLTALGTMLSLHAQHVDRTQHVGTQSGVSLAVLAQLEQDVQGLASDVSSAVVPRDPDSAASPRSTIFRGTATGFVCASWNCSAASAPSHASLPQVIVWQFVSRAGEHRGLRLDSERSGPFVTTTPGLARLAVDLSQTSRGERQLADWTASEFESVRFQYLGTTGWREAWQGDDGAWPRALQIEWQIRDASGAPHRGSRRIVLPPPTPTHGGRHARH